MCVFIRFMSRTSFSRKILSFNLFSTSTDTLSSSSFATISRRKIDWNQWRFDLSLQWATFLSIHWSSTIDSNNSRSNNVDEFASEYSRKSLSTNSREFSNLNRLYIIHDAIQEHDLSRRVSIGYMATILFHFGCTRSISYGDRIIRNEIKMKKGN